MKPKRLVSKRYKWVILEVRAQYVWLTPLPSKPREVRGGWMAHGQRYVGDTVFLIRNDKDEYEDLMRGPANQAAKRHSRRVALTETGFILRKYAIHISIILLALGVPAYLMWGEE